MHTNEVNPGGAEPPPGSRFGETQSEGLLKPSHSNKKPNPPFNAVGEGKVLHRTRRNLVSEFWLEVGFVVESAPEMLHYFSLSHGPLCGCEISGATRGGFSRKSHGTSMVSDADGNAGSSNSENLGLGKRIRQHHHDRPKSSWKTIFSGTTGRIVFGESARRA